MRKLFFVAIILFAAASARADISLTTCGLGVEDEEVGTLAADVACTTSSQTGVVLGEGSTLRLNGHTLSAGGNGVFCIGDCTIEGPGEIFGFAEAGIVSSTSPKPRIRVTGGAVIRDNLNYGILLAFDGAVRLFDVTITGNNRGGVAAAPGSYRDRGAVRGYGVTISDNDGPGAKARKLHFRDSVIQGNDGSGVFSGNGGVYLKDSTVTGNGTDFDPSYDVKTFRRPNLMSSECGRSVRVLEGNLLGDTWGVCSDD